jgi:hypothetical protein
MAAGIVLIDYICVVAHFVWALTVCVLANIKGYRDLAFAVIVRHQVVTFSSIKALSFAVEISKPITNSIK